MLRLASSEGLTADRAIEREDISITDRTSRVGIVQSGDAEVLAIRKEQGAKVASRHGQQICGQRFNQSRQVQLRCCAVRNFQQQSQTVAFAPQRFLMNVPLNSDARNVA